MTDPRPERRRPTPEPDTKAFAEYLRGAVGAAGRPLFVGLDGRSGAGKSTLATGAAAALGTDEQGHSRVTVIEGDGFYAGGSAASWDGRSANDKVAHVIEWRRQRAVLADLREQGVAEWRPFDWEADDWDADAVPLAAVPILAHTAPVVVLEGAYSCRPELHDLLDRRVLLESPDDVRRARLLARDGDAYRADWEARWTEAEEHYFGSVMPASSFDLVLGSATPSTDTVIADFEPADQAAVRALVLAGLGEHWGDVDEDLNPDLDDLAAAYGHGRTVVVRRGEEIVATGTVVPRDRSSAEIVRLSVAADERRAGLGRLVVEELVATARSWGASAVVLETTTAWLGSVAFYRACGFTVTHHEAGAFGDDTWLRREL